jgi:ribosomal protein S18 acetylase RimI-like enzyme
MTSPPLLIRPFRDADEAAVIALWRECGLIRSWNDPQKDIQRKKAAQGELFLVATLEDQIVASVMAGYEGHRGWVYYLAVTPAQQRRGHGERLMHEVERLLLERGCPKLNLMVRTSNVGVIEFYRRLGYSVDDAVPLGKRLISDEPPALSTGPTA